MKTAGSLVMVILLLCAASQAILPACGWYWPIMGFVPPSGGCPNICGGPGLPSPYDAMTPGTLQWGYPPVGRADLVYPGCAYGPKAFQMALDFGSILPFTSHRPGRYAAHEPVNETEAVSAENRTGIETGRTNNTTLSTGNTTGIGAIGRGVGEGRAGNAGRLYGWLSSR